MSRNNVALQWASIILPTIIAIVMAIITFTNRSTTINATTLEKVVQVEGQIEQLKQEIDDLDDEKVDKETFSLIIKQLDNLDKKLDELKTN